MLNSRRRVEVDWATVNAQLPIGRDDASKSARHKIFRSFDPNGNGLLSLAEVDGGLTKVLQIHGIAKPVMMRAFQAARDVAKPVASFSNDYIDKNEFRVLLVYLTYYLQLFEFFDRIDASGDRRVGPREFQAALPLLQRWGMKQAATWEANPQAAFREMDRNNGGKVLFDEFADFCLRHGLGQGQLGGFEDPADRKEALDMLKNRRPNMSTDGTKARELTTLTMVPQPQGTAQKGGDPPFGSDAESSVQKIQRERYRTSYHRSFAGNGTSVISPRALNAAPSALSATLKLQETSYQNGGSDRAGPDRAALRDQVNAQLDMYSTGQLRKILTMNGQQQQVLSQRPAA